MKDLTLRTAILSVSLLIMSPTAVSPALADMIAAFPEINPNTIMWVVTLPSIAMVVFSLVYSRLVKFMTKRSLLIIALTCFVLGGIAPVFMDNIYLILTMRGVFGIGIGFLMPMSSGLVADFYQGRDLEAMMGMQSAFVNFGGLVFMLVGGILAAIYWNFTFLVYLIGLPVAAFVLIKLPEPQKYAPSEAVKATVPPVVFKQIAGLFLFNLLFFVLMTNAAVMIVSESLGSAAQAGTVLTLFMVGGLTAGILFGKTAQLCSKYTNTAGWLATGAGMLLIAVSHSIAPIVTGAFIAGAGLATTMPSYLIKISALTPAAATSVAYAYAFCFIGIGQFISPPVFELIIALFGQDIGRFPIFTAALLLLLAGLINAVLTSLSPPSQASTNPSELAKDC